MWCYNIDLNNLWLFSVIPSMRSVGGFYKKKKIMLVGSDVRFLWFEHNKENKKQYSNIRDPWWCYDDYRITNCMIFHINLKIIIAFCAFVGSIAY